MKTIEEALYLHAPVLVQNVLVSLRGLQLERERRRGVYREMRERLAARRAWSAEQFARYQRTALARLLRDARRYVPWYRRRYRDLPFDEDPFAHWHLLPMLEKEAVRRAPMEFVDERHARGRLITLHTTGSTGTPLRIAADARSRQINYAFFDDYLDACGIDPAARRAVLGGRVVVAADRRQPPFWRYSLFQNALYLSAYHLSAAHAPAYRAALARFRPQFIEAYPSAIYALARHLGPGGARGLAPAGIVTSSETLDPLQREAIEEAFECRVHDQYGSAEMAQFVGQCSHGSYHVRPDYGLLEVVRDDGTAAGPGEEGEIVCTGLVNRVMPLIRYAIGDRGVLAGEACSCGLATPVLARISGRRDDLIRTPGGREVGRLSPVLKGFPVREAQYVQRRLDEVIVRVVPDGVFDAKARAALQSELRKRIGDDVTVRIETVSAIARGPGGKFRAVISELAAPQRAAVEG